MSILSFPPETIPLEVGDGGVVRVGKTRVTLETVLAAFYGGATAEEIVDRYPSLHLADVYSVIGYCLKRPAEIDAYLQQRKAESEAIRRENESRFDPQGARDRLLARRTKQEP